VSRAWLALTSIIALLALAHCRGPGIQRRPAIKRDCSSIAPTDTGAREMCALKDNGVRFRAATIPSSPTGFTVTYDFQQPFSDCGSVPLRATLIAPYASEHPATGELTCRRGVYNTGVEIPFRWTSPLSASAALLRSGSYELRVTSAGGHFKQVQPLAGRPSASLHMTSTPQPSTCIPRATVDLGEARLESARNLARMIVIFNVRGRHVDSCGTLRFRATLRSPSGSEANAETTFSCERDCRSQNILPGSGPCQAIHYDRVGMVFDFVSNPFGPSDQTIDSGAYTLDVHLVDSPPPVPQPTVAGRPDPAPRPPSSASTVRCRLAHAQVRVDPALDVMPGRH
jgi:hypothetical protein